VPGGAPGDQRDELRAVPPLPPPAPGFDRVWGAAATGAIVVIVGLAGRNWEPAVVMAVVAAVVAAYLGLGRLFR
jgi:hypothetical protein